MMAAEVDDYRDMLRIRLIEEELLKCVQDGRVIGSAHLCIGQEAIPVGACRALKSDDPVVATYRGHGWALAKGVPPVQFIGEVMGRDSTLNGGRGGSAYLSSPDHAFMGENSIVGGGLPMTLGLAMAHQRRATGLIPAVSIGDGAMNQGNVHESLNMGSVLGIPFIVIVENNGYAEMTPSTDLTATPAAVRAAAYAIEAIEVDGNSASAVAEATRRARELAISTQRPVMVEAHTRRLGGHYSGDAQAYRPKGELEEWGRLDPLTRARSLLDPTVAVATYQQVVAEVADAFARAARLPAPLEEEAMKHVYAN